MNVWLAVLLTALEAYLLGSLCFGIIFTRLFIHKDIREFGSGSAGMTNVLRAVGAVPGALTGLGDFVKGAAAIILGRFIFSSAFLDPYLGGYLAALCALLGHLFPLYFGFKGGKGVMITAGILLVLNPWLLLIVGLVFIAVFAASRIVSLSSISAAASLPLANLALAFMTDSEKLFSTLFALVMGALVIYMHRSNIRRLRAGEEKKIVIKKKESE
ncbi:MAG: glycerol-3-phosphate 1-O-acyltransferase PlsY [Oscillospiraceae bacterium]|nr:glycerol-3-phosphate 1-O-acyltransferase PlsY [Oscillospiraceae bacterium]